MLKQGVFIFCVIFVAPFMNECFACFRNNIHEKTVLQTGIPYFQECQCTEPGFTIENIRWLDIHDRLIEPGPGTNNDAYTEAAQDSIYLYIPSISKSMSGEYKCVTEVAGIRYVQTYTVDAYEPLYFFKTPTDQHLILGNNSMIACEARGESLPRISWQKEVGEEFVEIPRNDAKYQVTPEGLLVRNVTKDDAGKYKCTALVISTGEEVDKFIDVDIQTIPIIDELQAYPDVKVMAGELLSLECIAHGTPTPQYAWKKIKTENETKETNKIENKKLKHDTKKEESGNPENNTKAEDVIETEEASLTETWTQHANSIIFDSITAEDEGVYECNAYNDAGKSNKTIRVEVLLPPNITQFVNITEVEGTTIQLICNATGNPEPNITIIYEGWNVASDWELSEYEEIPNRAFVNLDRTHEGIYVCNASNEGSFKTPNVLVGYDTVPMYLTVLHRPYFKEENKNGVVWGYDGKTVKLNCATYSNPPAVLFWRFESNDIPNEEVISINKALFELRDEYLVLNIDTNSTFGMYVCTARNLIGDTTKFVSLKEGFRPPIINTPITIADITATSVTFEIEPLLQEDAPEILGYTALYDEESNYDVTDIHLNRTWSADRPYRIEKLKPNTTYHVRFAAINEVGAGEYGELIVFVTLEKSVPDSPVLEKTSIQRSAGGHLLKWKDGSDNGEPIDFYVLKYCPVYDELDDRLCEVRQIQPNNELELTDLESNTTYFLELIAHNAEGNSTPANISITIPVLGDYEEPLTLLSGGAIIGISIIIVVICLVLLDLLLLAWRRQGIIAMCCFDKDKKRKEDAVNSRDKKGLLIVEPVDTRPDHGHREFEYNKNTGVVTGKHSAV